MLFIMSKKYASKLECNERPPRASSNSTIRRKAI